MRIGLPIVMILALAAGDLYAEPIRVSSLKAKVHRAVVELKAARAKERATRDAQSELAHRISALKRIDRKRADDAELKRLLRDSIEADEALAGQIDEVQARQTEVLSAVRDAFERIDARIRELAPKLGAAHPIATRRAAAQEIRTLRSTRKEMRDVLLSVKEQERRRDWADYLVKIEPLDGPTELTDKADVVELTRRKLEKKRRLLARLIREKRVDQAAQSFTTDANLLDDNLRPGRVVRQGSDRGGNETVLADNGSQNAGTAAPEAPQSSRSADDAFVPTAGAQEADNNFAGSPAPPADPSPGRGETLADSQPQVGLATPNKSVTVTPQTPAPAAPGPIARQIDPNALINLRVEELDAEQLDLADLQKLIEELETLDRALDSQAEKIRNRAQQLERDEARAKQ